ncbi:uncharacterized protein LOC106663121 isoform X2 [Cimex lectularius]|nr:uncharacterized protein LOC106663121 isoform X2 [Cimex lectularius]XP_014243191.1 uncharacterized protein LOC106663121 isoform X2 [Cimex lectularius]
MRKHTKKMEETHESVCSSKMLRRKENQQDNRQHYSMDYRSYESALVKPEKKEKNTLDYMFPGYECRDPRDYYEKSIQSKISTSKTPGTMEQFWEDNFMVCDEKKVKVVEEEKLKEDALHCDEMVRSASLAPHGWVGPPLTVKLKLIDILYMEVTNVGKNPRVLRLHQKALVDNTLKVKVVPGPYYVPQVEVSLGHKRLFPDGNHESLIRENIVPRYPSLIFANYRFTKLQKTRPFIATMEGMNQRFFRFDEFSKDDTDMLPTCKKQIDLPDSWTDIIKLEEPVFRREYRLHRYDEKDEKESHSKGAQSLKVVLPERTDEYSPCERTIIMDKNFVDKKLLYYNPFNEVEPIPKIRHAPSRKNLRSQKSEIWEADSNTELIPTPSPPPVTPPFSPQWQLSTEKPVKFSVEEMDLVSKEKPVKGSCSCDYLSPVPSPEKAFAIPLKQPEIIIYRSPLPSPKHSYIVPAGKLQIKTSILPTQPSKMPSDNRIVQDAAVGSRDALKDLSGSFLDITELPKDNPLLPKLVLKKISDEIEEGHDEKQIGAKEKLLMHPLVSQSSGLSADSEMKCSMKSKGDETREKRPKSHMLTTQLSTTQASKVEDMLRQIENEMTPVQRQMDSIHSSLREAGINLKKTSKESNL